jgi:membrane dipeptidase
VNQYGTFDFGLTNEQETRASRLHQESLIIDLLYQGPIGPDAYPEELADELRDYWKSSMNLVATLGEAIMLPIRRGAEGRLSQFRDQWFESGLTAGNREVEICDLKQFSETLSIAQYQFDNCDWMIKALTAEDFRRAKRQGKAAGYVSTQLSFGPFPDLDVLRAAFQLGLRMVQLTYNSQTTVAAGCTDRTNAGVSNFGRAAIELMNELGIIVDTGHCGKQTTLDACELSSQPVVASHTAAEAVSFHDRCKSDEEIRALAATGGVIGIVVVPFFLKASPGADMNDFLDHVDHVAKLVGPEHVAIGTDWPMQLPGWVLTDLFAPLVSQIGFREEHRIDVMATLEGFSDYRDFPNITRGLVSRGYSDDEIAGILGENFLRVWETVCG